MDKNINQRWERSRKITMIDENKQEDLILSKTKVKQEMHKLQALGERLTKLSQEERNRLEIPISLEEAVQNYTKIKSNSALRRQLQFIGKLMRELPTENVNIIINYFSIVDGNNQSYNAYIQRLEKTRDALITEDGSLTEYLNQHPEIKATYLRTLIRNCKKEMQDNKPSKSYRAIFKFLKTVEPFSY